MKHRTVARAGNVDVPPAHNRHDDRTEAWVRFRQDALWGIPEAHRLLRPLGKEVAWDTKLGLKSFKSFFRRKALTQNQDASANADHRHRMRQGAGAPLQEIFILSITPTNCSFARENIRS
jgi:hypothetical protein